VLNLICHDPFFREIFAIEAYAGGALLFTPRCRPRESLGILEY